MLLFNIIMLVNETEAVIRRVMPDYGPGISNPFVALDRRSGDCIASSVLSCALEQSDRIVKHSVEYVDEKADMVEVSDHFLFVSKDLKSVLHSNERGFYKTDIVRYAYMFDGGFSNRMIMQAMWEDPRFARREFDVMIGGKVCVISIESVDPSEMLGDMKETRNLRDLREEALKKYIASLTVV